MHLVCLPFAVMKNFLKCSPKFIDPLNTINTSALINTVTLPAPHSGYFVNKFRWHSLSYDTVISFTYRYVTKQWKVYCTDKENLDSTWQIQLLINEIRQEPYCSAFNRPSVIVGASNKKELITERVSFTQYKSVEVYVILILNIFVCAFSHFLHIFSLFQVNLGIQDELGSRGPFYRWGDMFRRS
jgi:hypothetical protein